MSVKKTKWNIVVVGSWNPALLSPAGIMKHVLGIEGEHSIEVGVQLDDPTQPAFSVKYEGMTFQPVRGKLIIDSASPNCESLKIAAEYGKKAIQSLPKTPFHGAGVNLRYTWEDCPVDVSAMFGSELESRFLSRDIGPTRRRAGRTLPFKDGEVNVNIEWFAGERLDITLNFNCQSSQSEALISWLDFTTEEIEQESNSILSTLFMDDWPLESEHFDEEKT